jgi:hypothetical protein
MTLLKAKGKLFYFAHIPKTGGSTVETAMRKAGAKRALHFHKRLDYVRCNLQHMHAELFDTFIPAEFYHKGFCVVRHPVARLISEYRWRQTLEQSSLPFDSWVRKQITAYAEDQYILDNHLRPQHEFIGRKIQVFRFEDGMETILAQVSKMTGLTLNPKTHVRKPSMRQPLTWTPETRALTLRFFDFDFSKLEYDYDTEIPDLSIAR